VKSSDRWTKGVPIITQALFGTLLGGGLFAIEALVVAAVDGSWTRLGNTPLICWATGSLAGAGAGIAAALLIARFSGGESTEPRDRCRESAPLLLGLLVAPVLLIQMNERWGLDTGDPRSIAASALLLAAIAAICWHGRGAIGRALRGPASSRAKLLAAIALSAAGAIAATSIAPAPGPAALRKWRHIDQRPSFVESDTDGRRRLLFLGIDGAQWELIDPLVEAGKMPHLASLIGRGRRGVLRSSVRSASPVVWTTIFSGRPSESHGIVGWEQAVSSNRRVKALWNILDDRAWTPFVVNVPGTYPAEELAGGMLSGFPLPQGSRSNLGWRVSSHAGFAPGGPLHEILPPADPGSGRSRVVLRDLCSDFALQHTSPYVLLRRFDRYLAAELARRLSGTPYVAFDVEHAPGNGAAAERVRGYPPGGDRPLFELASGEWSPWLSVTIDGSDHVTRIHALETAGETELYALPLLPAGGAAISRPSVLASWAAGSDAPYVVEGAGWQIFRDPSLLQTLEQHLGDVAQTQASAATRLARRAPWDALIHIFTQTDRTQHPFWKFREPALYDTLLSDSQERRLLPDDRQIRRYGGAIDRAYQQVDRTLEALLEEAGDSTLVVIVSDHGAQGGRNRNSPSAGIHHQEGIYLIAGPTVPAPESAQLGLGPTLDQVDVLPLVLSHLGLPLGTDLPGSVPPELFPRSPEGALLALPPALPTLEDPDAVRIASPATIGADVRSQLRSLGYLN